MKLPFFSYWRAAYIERDVPFELRIGTLEDICEELKIDFWQMKEFAEKHPDVFNIELLWQGYLTGCRLQFCKPKYKKAQAVTWYNKMNREMLEELKKKMEELYGKLTLQNNKKKVTKKKTG